MNKKLIGIVVIAIMLFGVFGLAGCDNISLAEYKAEAKAQIQAHANTKSENDYTSTNWTVLQLAVTEGKQAVEDATSKVAVDAAVTTAKTTIDNVTKKDEIVREKLHDSWWDGKVEVLLDFPRVVQQGDAFSIIVTTLNLLDVEIEKLSGSCCQNKGVLISKIKLQSVIEYEMKHRHFDVHNEDEVLTTISVGGFLEAIWEIETTHPEQFVAGVAPKGIYDIYLSNGEVLRSAITIV